jgi:hypothetical protein
LKPIGWARHFQHGWAARAVDDRWNAPLWLRVAFLAYSRHDANGHARFEVGEIGKILGRRDPGNVSKAIKEAVRLDWLDLESCPQCLVVPPHLIQGGLGNAENPCEFHEQKRKNRREKAITRTIGSNSQFVEVQPR